MPIIARDNRQDLSPAPEGLHQAVCCDVVDLGMIESSYGDKRYQRHCVQIRWMIDLVDPKTNKRYMVVKRYTLSLHRKADLRKHLEAWRSRKFTEEELEGFDLENLIGANCQLQIVQNISDNTTYANVQAIVPIGKGMVKMQVGDEYVRVKDRDGTRPAETSPVEEEEDPLPF